MKETLPPPHDNALASTTECGSSLFIILLGVALFAALGYALSRGGSGVAALSTEKVRLLASDVMDMGNGLTDAVARLRINKVATTKISFENTVVAGYTNAACTTDSCKIFAYDGGGKEWETTVAEINGGKKWGFTGDLALTNTGTPDADLVALLPDVSEPVCNRINTLAGLYATGGTPSTIAAVTATKFTGSYAAVPSTLSDGQINGQKSGCFRITTAAGTAFDGAPLSNTYVFYQVLIAR